MLISNKKQKYGRFAFKAILLSLIVMLPSICLGLELPSVRVPHEFEEGVKILNQKDLDLKEVQEHFDLDIDQISQEIEIIDSCLAVEKDPDKREIFSLAKEFKRSEALKSISDYLNQILNIRNDMENALTLIYRGTIKAEDSYNPKKYVAFINELQMKNYEVTKKMYNASLIKANKINDPVVSRAIDRMLVGFSKLSDEYEKHQGSFLNMTKQIQNGMSSINVVKDQVQLAKVMFSNVTEFIEAQRSYLNQFTQLKGGGLMVGSISDQLKKFFTKLGQIKADGLPDIAGILDDVYKDYDFDLGWDDYLDDSAYSQKAIGLYGENQFSTDELVNSVLEKGKPVKPVKLESFDVGF